MSHKRARDAGPRPRSRAPRRRARTRAGPARIGPAAAPERKRADHELDREIRALREHSRSLEQARAHYADLFDFAPVTYALLDQAGLVLKVNLAGCRLLRVERARLVRRPLLAFVAPQDRREFLDHLRRCRAGAGVVESEVRFGSGRQATTCRLYSKRASYEQRDAFPTVIVDQSEHLALDDARLTAERRRTLAERDSAVARAASAAKDRFLAVVSHELRTPLTPALFAASRLAAWDGLSDQARRLAATIERNIEVEAKLIDDLLDVARINRDRLALELELETVDAHDVLREAVAVCRPLVEAKRLGLEMHALASAHHVRADRARLRQVFWNLLNNAIRFTGSGGRIVVRSADADDAVLRVVVRDTGAGMDADVLQHLFAPFDGRSVDQESRGGLGLGLTICKGIIGAHGGQIWATSEGPGLGSTFGVELATVEPTEGQERAIENSEPAGAGPRESARLRILLIEDDQDISDMLSLFLSQYGCVVEVASSLRAGLERLDERWDVVLSDIGLPDGSGLDVARRARQAPRPPRRLIALTGYGTHDDLTASREAGFDEHVVKPLDLDRLLAALDLPLMPPDRAVARER